MQHIRFDRSIKLSNLVCLNQTRILHFDILSLLLTEQLCIDFIVTLKKNIPFNPFILLGKCLQEQAFHSCDTYFLCVLIRLSEEQTSPVFIWRHAKKNVCKETLFLCKNGSKISPLLHPSILSLAWSIPKHMSEDRVVARLLQEIIKTDGQGK